ncbi:uncharacterized protein LOC120014112 [Tripterygium wilfordii]|uniref:uncharacterized protein LOC120014112 n=1 Tax=Tripterygium wilfordii TaxID=458696 RepID=UPI0018F85DCD|nr:uncharacterized protein LOC120014112 [Tripterygium wilfordii]
MEMEATMAVVEVEGDDGSGENRREVTKHTLISMDFFPRRRKKKITADSPLDDDVVETLAIGLAVEFEGSSSNRGSGQSRSYINRNTLSGHDPYSPYFRQRRNAAGKLGLSSLQKITVALRMLAYGVSTDLMDEYIRIGETTAIESLKKFVKCVISVFGDEYLRSPTTDDLTRLLAMGEAVAFLEWSHNDINVLERSTVFQDLAMGRAPAVNYSINGHNYTMRYYLADGIYPTWATFVKTIPAPPTRKLKHFVKCQESARKDVERAFGVLQA